MPRTTVLVGTTKGAFLLDGTEDRDAWSVAGPFCDGWPINHMAGDSESGALWAAGGNDWCGAGVWRSSDHGASWQLSKLANGQMDAWLADDPEMARTFGTEPSPPAPITRTLESSNFC